jgi:peptidoglycan/LPS O-acetylase OafA/YrhL
VSSGITADPLRTNRADGIDVLRALLALWVVLTHLVSWCVAVQGPAAVPRWLAATMSFSGNLFQPVGELHPGVLAFIVLSGYCIHRAGLRGPGAGAMTGYAFRRFFRIMPVYYLATVAGVIGFVVASRQSPSLAAMLSGTHDINPSCVAAKALFLPALYPGVYECSFLGNAPLATVLVEVVLYVIYAAAFAGLAWPRREAAIWVAVGFLFAASVAILAWGVSPGIYGWWQNGSLIGFVPYWWLGVAFVNPAFAAMCRRRLWLLAVAWAALTALLMWGHPPGGIAIAELRKLVFAIGIGVLIRALDQDELKGWGAVALIGRAGYGLYALHAPLTYTLVIYGAPWWGILVANLLMCLAIHRTIERPMIRCGRFLRERLVARPLAAGA